MTGRINDIDTTVMQTTTRTLNSSRKLFIGSAIGAKAPAPTTVTAPAPTAPAPAHAAANGPVDLHKNGKFLLGSQIQSATWQRTENNKTDSGANAISLAYWSANTSLKSN